MSPAGDFNRRRSRLSSYKRAWAGFGTTPTEGLIKLHAPVRDQRPLLRTLQAIRDLDQQDLTKD